MTSQTQRRRTGSIVLANGHIYGVTASHPRVDTFVGLFLKTMGMRDNVRADVLVCVRPKELRASFPPLRPGSHAFASDLQIPTTSLPAAVDSDGSDPGPDTRETISLEWECEDESGTFLQLLRLSHTLVRRAEQDGAILVHAGLVADETGGVLLAGPSGAGKSTAANRIPPPWRTLSDDLALIVADASGEYWAHPWPTWSTFDRGGQGGTWAVSQAVPLRVIFFLTQGPHDQVTHLGGVEAVGCLNVNVQEASMPKLLDLPAGVVRESNLRRFDGVRRLAETIPVHNLQHSKSGAYWKEIERARQQVYP